eukprot:TRINITY_DN13991_c0_g1_i2.p1 TRINITY_DN13991_c0_g1~~TRINITY_DN13991_c0_g1_i2.p1  ORF type:complete len:274 (+),score=35.55 TRINITY_DN13991_c0_g1_i2:813-1634(+)
MIAATLPPYNRKPYHRVVRCLGFKWNATVLAKPLRLRSTNRGKYPEIYKNFSLSPNFFVIGALMHSNDYRKSSGGFIHGFRYLIRSLFWLIAMDRGDAWPELSINADTHSAEDFIAERVIARVNEDSAMYQMSGVIGDIFRLEFSPQTQDFSIRAFRSVVIDWAISGIFPPVVAVPFITVSLEYARNFHGCCKTLQSSVANLSNAAESNFLHPIVRIYLWGDFCPVQLAAEHHILEDFNVEFRDTETHINPLRYWLRHVLSAREWMRFYTDCF